MAIPIVWNIVILIDIIEAVVGSYVNILKTKNGTISRHTFSLHD